MLPDVTQRKRVLVGTVRRRCHLDVHSRTRSTARARGLYGHLGIYEASGDEALARCQRPARDGRPWPSMTPQSRTHTAADSGSVDHQLTLQFNPPLSWIEQF